MIMIIFWKYLNNVMWRNFFQRTEYICIYETNSLIDYVVNGY